MKDEPQVRSAWFPVAGRQGVAFETVHVERLTALDRNERFAIAPGLSDVVEILMDSRTADPPAKRLDGVSVIASGKGFGGKSYGLALAIADERARALGSPSGPLIATGRILERRRGTVGEIESFAAKADAAIAFAAARDEPVDFAFPKANWESADPEVRERLQQAQRTGQLRLHRCERVGDAARLWLAATPRKPYAQVGMVAVVLLITAGSAAGFASWRGRDARACEAATTALGENPGGNSIALAVQVCRKASEAAPGNGRLHQLHADALALNGSTTLAAAEWKKAAEAGDPEGLASYGRFLWQSDPTDPKMVAAALDLLKRGSAKGSIRATQDVGYVLLDGGALPADPAAAQRWMAKAQRMRASTSE